MSWDKEHLRKIITKCGSLFLISLSSLIICLAAAEIIYGRYVCMKNPEQLGPEGHGLYLYNFEPELILAPGFNQSYTAEAHSCDSG